LTGPDVAGTNDEQMPACGLGDCLDSDAQALAFPVATHEEGDVLPIEDPEFRTDPLALVRVVTAQLVIHTQGYDTDASRHLWEVLRHLAPETLGVPHDMARDGPAVAPAFAGPLQGLSDRGVQPMEDGTPTSRNDAGLGVSGVVEMVNRAEVGPIHDDGAGGVQQAAAMADEKDGSRYEEARERENERTTGAWYSNEPERRMGRQLARARDDSDLHPSSQHTGDEFGQLSLHPTDWANVVRHDGDRKGGR
jgi:hypothetical protein